MKNQGLYNRTIDILVQAYLNDTLEHGNCYACAVGNMIAANMNIKMERVSSNDSWGRNTKWEGRSGYSEGNWYNNPTVLSSRKGEGFDWLNYIGSRDRNWPESRKPFALEQINSTGYSKADLILIERAFETCGYGVDDEEHMFNGLMAVIDILNIIHENKDEDITADVKSRFSKVS